jgi:small subunit ribosomal protein S4e
MHVKRKTIPKFWPIQRTGTKYMAVPVHDRGSSMPLMIVMRDVLKLVKTRKELQKVLNDKKILVNGKITIEKNYPICLFDTLAIPSIKKFYRATLNDKKMGFEEIKESEISTRMFKVIGKKILTGKKVQLNFSNGKNLISNEKLESGNFVVMDMLSNKIKKTIILEKGAKVLIIEGKHIGKSGKINEIVTEGENVIAKIKSADEEISTNITNLFAIE